MAITIEKTYVETFESNIRHLAQQKGSKLRNYVMESGLQGKNHSWDRATKTEAVTKSGKLVATPELQVPFSRRVSVPIVKHWGDTYEEEDIVQMLIDPQSTLVDGGSMAMGRAIDDILIAAATGTALDGDGVANAFPAGQGIGSATTVFSFDLVTQATEKFLANDIDPDDQKVFVIGPTQMRKMLQLTEATSSDYANAKALAERGFIESWMGYGWVVSNRLTIPVAGELYCLTFCNKALGLETNMDIRAKVAEDPSKSFAWRVYLQMVMGAVRVEDEQIIRVHVKNSLT
jgi:hypothetical protein